MAYEFNQVEKQILTTEGPISGLKTLVARHGLSP